MLLGHFRKVGADAFLTRARMASSEPSDLKWPRPTNSSGVRRCQAARAGAVDAAAGVVDAVAGVAEESGLGVEAVAAAVAGAASGVSVAGVSVSSADS